MTQLPRILILYTGGTFGMEGKENDSKDSLDLRVPALSNRSLKKRMIERAPELGKLAKCDVDIIFNRDSAHIGPAEWLVLAQKIRRSARAFDGIVVIHGTDTLAYSASALSFLLRPCKIPVVITGAQRPLSALRTDARSNLVSAVDIAANGPRSLVRQVTVFFGDKLYQGNRVRKVSALDYQAFVSPHAAPLAVVGTTIRYAEGSIRKVSVNTKLSLKLDRRVLMLHVTPGLPSESLTDALLAQIDAVVLVVFQSWTAPTHDSRFMQFLARARTQKIPIVIVNESSNQQPSTDSPSVNYTAGLQLLAEGCLLAGSMTPECTYVKVMMILSMMSQPDLRMFAKLWRQNYACEGM